MKLSNLQKRLTESDPYQPAEDTFFLADHIENETGKTALDIGTGSGFLAKILSNSFDLVAVSYTHLTLPTILLV